MKLQQPKIITFWIAVVLAVIGVIAHLGIIAALAPYGIWFVVVGFVLLLLGTLFTGL